jgi:hypothetical protein
MEINGELFDGLSYFSTHNNPLIGYKDINGNIVIPQQFDVALDFSCGLCAVGIFNKEDRLMCGFIDTKGEIVIPLIYREATSFKEYENLLYARVKNEKSECFYINHKGERINTPLNSTVE